MLVESNLKIKQYNTKDAVRICNPKQRDFYLLSGVMPVDIYTSEDEKSGKKILVYIFLKENTKDLYQRWLNYDTEV